MKKVTSATQLGLIVGTNEYKLSTIYKIKSYKIHSKYNAIHLTYDVAMLKLDKNLTFSNSIRPVTLPKKTDNVTVGEKGTVSGWGYTRPAQRPPSPSRSLKSTTMKIINQTTCENIIKINSRGRRIVSDSIFCAEGDNHQSSTCFVSTKFTNWFKQKFADVAKLSKNNSTKNVSITSIEKQI